MEVSVAPTGELIVDAKALVDAVKRDECGQMVGQMWVGGNGGLLSRETLKAADKLRATLAKAAT